MADEFDATRATALPPAIVLLAALLILGVGLELAMGWLERRAWVRRHRRLKILLYNLRWQPLLWTVIAALHVTMPRTWMARMAAILGINPLLWLAIITAAVFVVRLLSGMASRYAEEHNVPSTSVLAGVIHGVGLLAVALLGAALLGVPVDGILLALAGSSVGIGLALQQPLTNLFAGLLLNAADRFRPGELIRLNTGQEGRVVDIDWLTTTLEDGSTSLVAVPNQAMLTAVVVNFDRPNPPISFDVPIAVSRDCDVRHVERVTLDVANAVALDVPGVLRDAPPVVGFPLGIDDYVLRFCVTFRVESHARRGAVQSAFVRRLEGRYVAEGISVAHPVGMASAGSPKAPAILVGARADAPRAGAP
jgi:small-conductance mechanosensitive channel